MKYQLNHLFYLLLCLSAHLTVASATSNVKKNEHVPASSQFPPPSPTIFSRDSEQDPSRNMFINANTPATVTSGWHQYGGTLKFENRKNDSHDMTSLSGDGMTIAICRKTFTQINKLNPDSLQWQQHGNNIVHNVRSQFVNIVLAEDASAIVLGESATNGSTGTVRVFVLDDDDDDGMFWEQRGSGIDGYHLDDYSGDAVSISADGSRIAVGAWKKDNYGNVRLFDYDEDSDGWLQAGQDLDGSTEGTAKGGRFGWSVSLSSDGSRLAVGVPMNSNFIGSVKTYEFNKDKGSSWNELGYQVYGDAPTGLFRMSVALSGDGNTLLAIGAPYSNIGGRRVGQARVFRLETPTSGTTSIKRWVQLGQTVTRGGFLL